MELGLNKSQSLNYTIDERITRAHQKIRQLEELLAQPSSQMPHRSVSPGREAQLQAIVENQEITIEDQKSALARLKNLNTELKQQLTQAPKDCQSLAQLNQKLQEKIDSTERLIMEKQKKYDRLLNKAIDFELRAREMYEASQQLNQRVSEVMEIDTEGR